LELRKSHTFDVYSLNYCSPGSAGDELRQYIREEDAKRGYLSWQSTITLDVPAANDVVETPGQAITTSAYVRYKVKKI